MKSKTFFLICALSLMVCALDVSAQNAKPEPNVYVTLEYMHVKPGGGNEYLQVEKLWKNIHQQRLKNGNILDWSVWEVQVPYSDNAKYQYVVLTVYPKLSDYLQLFKGIDIQKVFPGISQDSVSNFFQRTSQSRELIHTSVYETLYHNEKPGEVNYVMFTEMKAAPGKEKAYENLELKDWQPIHADLIKNGFESGCNFFKLVFPAESGNRSDYAIARVFKDAEMIDKLNQIDWSKYQKANPAAFSNTDALRNEVHTEIDHKVLDLENGN